MPSLAQVTLRAAQFSYDGSDHVAFLLEHASFGNTLVSSTQTAVEARVPTEGANPGPDEVLAEAQAQADILWPDDGVTVAWPAGEAAMRASRALAVQQLRNAPSVTRAEVGA